MSEGQSRRYRVVRDTSGWREMSDMLRQGTHTEREKYGQCYSRDRRVNPDRASGNLFLPDMVKARGLVHPPLADTRRASYPVYKTEKFLRDQIADVELHHLGGT
jgi:hypothetical protein